MIDAPAMIRRVVSDAIATPTDAKNSERSATAMGTCQSTSALSRAYFSAPSSLTSIWPTKSTTCGRKPKAKRIANIAPTLAKT